MIEARSSQSVADPFSIGQRLRGFPSIALRTVLCAGLMLNAFSPLWAEDVHVRKAVPTPEEMKLAQKRVAETYKDLATVKKSKYPEDLVQLAKELMRQGASMPDANADAYECLDEAKQLFEGAGDIRNALLCINELSKRFDVNPVPLKINTVIDGAKSTTDFRTSFDSALELVRIAQDEGQFDKITALLQVAQGAAAKIGDKKLSAIVVAMKKESADLKKENDAYEKAAKVLDQTPDDPASNLAVGKYWCFIRGDWAKGAGFVLKGNDATLKTLVQRELDAPKDLREMASLAEAWWDLSERGSMRSRYQREAVYWYEIIAQYGAGLAKVTAEKRLQQVSGRSPRRPLQPGLVQLSYLDTELKSPGPTRIVPNVDNNLDANAANMGLPSDSFSLAWVGYLRIPESGAYTLRFDTDDGGRLWLDDQMLFDQWTGGQNRNSLNKQLTTGLYRIRAHYFEGGGNANVVLYWKHGDAQLAPIPAEMFFHDPNIARAVEVK